MSAADLQPALRMRRPVLMIAAFAIALLSVACGKPATVPPAKYPVSVRVKLAASSPSLVLYSDCGSPFGGLAGVANSDDDATILASQQCNGSWWYQVQVGALAKESWKGIGWLPEDNLKLK